MKIRGSVVSFILPHLPEDEKKQKNYCHYEVYWVSYVRVAGITANTAWLKRIRQCNAKRTEYEVSVQSRHKAAHQTACNERRSITYILLARESVIVS